MTTNEHGGQVALSWEDAQTRCTLRLPYVGGQEAELDIQDRRAPEDQARRAEQAVAFDRSERKTRLASNQPLTRIPRFLEVGWALRTLQVQLGMSRAQVMQAIPGGQAVSKRDVADGLCVTFTGEPARAQTFQSGQIFIRFDANDRVAELRALYQSGPETKGVSWTRQLLNVHKKSCGAPEELPASWTAAWPDLPAQKPAAALYRWVDDRTVLTYQCDAGGAEVVFRECSA